MLGVATILCAIGKDEDVIFGQDQQCLSAVRVGIIIVTMWGWLRLFDNLRSKFSVRSD